MSGLLIPKRRSKKVFQAKADIGAAAVNGSFVRIADIRRKKLPALSLGAVFPQSVRPRLAPTIATGWLRTAPIFMQTSGRP